MACHKRGPRFWERPSVSISCVRPRELVQSLGRVRHQAERVSIPTTRPDPAWARSLIASGGQLSGSGPAQSDRPLRVSEPMNTVWTSRISQAAAKYGEAAPTATGCCNACRTCVQTNLISLASLGRSVWARVSPESRGVFPNTRSRIVRFLTRHVAWLRATHRLRAS
jgi:hypothetical protein